MKLIFLDIDGVMTANNTMPDSSKLYTFSPTSVSVLNRLLIQHDAKIILTSSWRTVFDLEAQSRIFVENGVIQTPYDQTTDLGYFKRSHEIQMYLSKKRVNRFVILDDMKIEGFENNFVLIDPRYGLTVDYIEKINTILS